MYLFFSPNKLIDYSPAICIRLLTSTRYLRTSVAQTRSLRPTSISFIEKAPSSSLQVEAGACLGAAKNEMRGPFSPNIANLLSLYGKNTTNTPSLRSGRHSQDIPLRPCRVVVSRRILVLKLVYTVCAYHV